MRVVVALGGRSLLRRGQVMTVENQLENVAVACAHLAPVAVEHDLVISHGNGPQGGLPDGEGATDAPIPDFPLDVLRAETQGMIGYLIERELTNRLPSYRHVATIMTMIEVDATDPAFSDPREPIGPVYSSAEAAELERERGWVFRSDRGHFRRVVPSPLPKRIIEDRVIHGLLATHCVVLCAGGGAIPIATDAFGHFYGVEAVIDKDLASGLLAKEVSADVFVMATDTRAAYLSFGSPDQRAITAADPDVVLADYREEFAAGSMLPKITAACEFARSTGRTAVIGEVGDIESLVAGSAGTRISSDITGVHAAPIPTPTAKET